ncbi:MAG: aldo/keto reductase [Propionibacteriaceae bacterium]|jgi:L-glyceraldehyde 3-phosphate reductase|nr:aldo/keto reductase [Propionibacteriaceae bacterium]
MAVSPQFVPDPARYDGRMPYHRCGKWGLKLPAISLGLWQNFGDNVPFDRQEAILRRAFDLGVTHFDLANNYGPPAGAAEANFGRHVKRSFSGLRGELVISTKAGYRMWPGPYGEWGSRKYLLDSLDASLARMGLDHVDIFYSHRYDPATPLEETMGALDFAVRSGRARYVGVSSYSAPRTREALAILRELGTPAVIHQPSYSMLNRWIEEPYIEATSDAGAGTMASGTPRNKVSVKVAAPDHHTDGPGETLIDVLADEGLGCIVFSPLAQGLLTDKYLNGTPAGSRATKAPSWRDSMLTEENLARVRALNALAGERGQTLAQMAVAWVLRQPTVTSALVGASSVAQLEDTVGALTNLDFDDATLRRIDQYAKDGDINIWKQSSFA